MATSEKIRHVLNLKQGEGRAVSLMISYSFLMGISYAFLFTISTTLFLSDFKVSMIPYAYIGGGVLSYFVWLLYSFFEKRTSFQLRLHSGTLFLLITLSAIAVAYILTGNKIFSFLLFLWVNIFLFVNGVGFWGIASRVFDLQQGKRLFGLIGSGEILAKSISFLSIPLLVKFVPTKELLYVSIGALFLCHLLMLSLIRHFGDRLQATKKKGDAQGKGEQGKKFLEILKNKYLFYIFILAMIPLFGAYFVDFTFLDQTKLQFKNPKLVSSFLGLFFGFMAICEFVLKTFISGRLITKYGVLFSLLVLPLMLMVTTLTAGIYGTLFGVTAMFFSFIALSKLFVRIFRTAFLDPTFQILYQPIPVHERLSFQSKIEGVPKSMGNIFAGLILLLFANLKSLTVIHYNYILFAVLVYWAWLSYKLYGEYRQSLRALLHEKKEESEDEAAPGKLLTSTGQALMTANANLQTFLLVQQASPYDFNEMAKLIAQQGTRVKKLLLLESIKTNPDEALVQILNKAIANGWFKDIQAEADEANRLATAYLQNQEEQFRKMMHSYHISERIAAARLMPLIQDPDKDKMYTELLKDQQPSVRRQALLSAGQTGETILWPYLLRELDRRDSAFHAFLAIKEQGSAITGDIQRYERRTEHKRYTQSFIRDLLLETNDEELIAKTWIDYPFADGEEKQLILRRLKNKDYKVPVFQTALVKQLITEEVNMICWIAAALVDISEEHGEADITTALQEEMHQKRINVFLLLSLLYDSTVLNYLIDRADDNSGDLKAYAIEILDMTVSDDLKNVLLPLLSEPSYDGMLKAYRQLFYQEKMEPAERLVDIVNKDYLVVNQWTKASAMMALKQHDTANGIFVASLHHPVPILKEMATHVMLNKYPAELDKLMERYSELVQQELSDAKEKMQEKYFVSIYDKVKLLKKNALFTDLSYMTLVNIVMQSETKLLATSEKHEVLSGTRSVVFFVVSGNCVLLADDRTVGKASREELIWYQPVKMTGSVFLLARKDSLIIQLYEEGLMEMLYRVPSQLPKISHVVSL